MDLLKDRRIVLAIGGGVALLLGALIAVSIMRGDKGSDKPPPASQGGLVVETGRDDDTKLDASRPIRCFVAGQFVGEVTLADCAKRNGVATGALDVGVDETGALAAADVAGTILAPLPPKEVVATPAPAVVEHTAPTAAPTAGSACLRYAGGAWSTVGSMDLNGCVQTLFSGQCEKRGGATYGRWGEQTLRLVKDRVEISNDNRRFRTLVDQGANCAIPPVG
ncbi:hypothetical protein [Caulobacter mirabilis]|uniref:Uncharacterized protein n=1 Tax=Caulobacter mirabilis TaxID=69666 RepID=A0A2D2AZU1_9CAUL|nr:hypothetical protein [Caulobacter mirabilis]ATQ43447.1 hypothetical protein CSW64_14020 [Caulobacter mirabilis]